MHEWVASLGHGPTQGAVGKSGKGKDDKGKGKGKGGDWKGGGDMGKGLGAGKGERPGGPVLIVGVWALLQGVPNPHWPRGIGSSGKIFGQGRRKGLERMKVKG